MTVYYSYEGCDSFLRKITKEMIMALGFSAIILLSLLGLHIVQAGSFEYVSPKEAIVRYAVMCQDLDANSSGYGGFAPSISQLGGYRILRPTVEAVGLLSQLNATNRINEAGVLHFLNASEIRITYNPSYGYYGTYYYDGMGYVYSALSILKSLDKMAEADALINMTALHLMIVNQQIANRPTPDWATVHVADLLGWTDELNRTLYAERLYDEATRYILSSYGCARFSSYIYGDFYGICRDLTALYMVGGEGVFNPDLRFVNDFRHSIETFLSLRWDVYNNGYADDISGFIDHNSIYPRYVVASVRPTYTCLELANRMGIDIPGLLGYEDSYPLLLNRSQTKYGFFDSSLPAKMLYSYPISVSPDDFSIEDNYNAISLLNFINKTQFLDIGRFRWPSNSMTQIENLGNMGYLTPLIITVVILPVLVVALINRHQISTKIKESEHGGPAGI